MAGLDGIENKIDPGEPLDKDIYALSPEELEGRPAQVPGSLDEALERARAATTSSCSRATSSRHDVIETWIDYKRENEVDADPPAPAPVRVRALLRHLSRFRTGRPVPNLRQTWAANGRRSDRPVGLSAVFRLAPVLWALTPARG